MIRACHVAAGPAVVLVAVGSSCAGEGIVDVAAAGEVIAGCSRLRSMRVSTRLLGVVSFIMVLKLAHRRGIAAGRIARSLHGPRKVNDGGDIKTHNFAERPVAGTDAPGSGSGEKEHGHSA